MFIAKLVLRAQEPEATELGLCIKNEGEGDSWRRELQVDGFVFLDVKVKIQEQKGGRSGWER